MQRTGLAGRDVFGARFNHEYVEYEYSDEESLHFVKGNPSAESCYRHWRKRRGE